MGSSFRRCVEAFVLTVLRVCGGGGGLPAEKVSATKGSCPRGWRLWWCDGGAGGDDALFDGIAWAAFKSYICGEPVLAGGDGPRDDVPACAWNARDGYDLVFREIYPSMDIFGIVESVFRLHILNKVNNNRLKINLCQRPFWRRSPILPGFRIQYRYPMWWHRWFGPVF